jgi:hypothetical protein
MIQVPGRGPGLRLERITNGGSGSQKWQSYSRSQPQNSRTRSLVVAACFLATFIAYVERTGFSVAYTAAAKEHAVSEAVKGTVLSSFFWGYAVSQASVRAYTCCRIAVIVQKVLYSTVLHGT